MTLKLSDRELEQLLRGPRDRDLRPPEALLARLRADLPTELPADLRPSEDDEPAPPFLRPAPIAPFWRRPIFAVAASLAVLLGGSFLALRVSREVAESPQPSLARQVPAAAKPEQETLTAKEAKSEARNEEELGSFPAAPPLAQQQPPAFVPAPTEAQDEMDSFAAEAVPSAQPVQTAETQSLALSVGSSDAAQDTAAPTDLTEKKVTVGSYVLVTRDAEQARADAAPTGLEDTTTTRELAQPQKLESPAIEANAVADSHLGTLGTADADKGLEDSRRLRLESPTTQGDVLREGAAPPPAPAASLPREARGRSELAEEQLLLSWRPIERALAEGRWPLAGEIESARALVLTPALPKNKSAAEGGGSSAADPAQRLMADFLDALTRKELSLAALHEMRQRAVKLAEHRPGDPRVAAILRSLNLAGKLLSD